MGDNFYIIGEEHYSDLTFRVTRRLLPSSKVISYSELFKCSDVIASDAVLLQCFPYSDWDQTVEKGDCLYGTGLFGERIKELSERIQERVETRFPYLFPINPLDSMLVERDKKGIKKILREKGIRVAEELPPILDAVLQEVAQGNSVYIKPNYGSMGKGITYLSPKLWTTNFKYDGRSIENHKVDEGWREIEITGDQDFIRRILEEDVIVERAVKNPLTNGLKIDLRVRSIFGISFKELSFGRTVSNASITNFSQGGIAVSLDKLEEIIPKDKIEEALRIMAESSRHLGFNYCGNDVLFEGNDYKSVFIESNSFPGFPSNEEKGEEIIRKIWEGLDRIRN